MIQVFNTKQKRYKMDQQTKNRALSFKRIFGVALVVAVLCVGFFGVQYVRADQFDEKIKALQQQNNKKAQNVSQLGSQAENYKDAIHKLQQQINSLQGQINDNKEKVAGLQSKIDAAEVELNKQKKLLGEDIRAMYVEGQISTLEMLASSKDLSDFVDKQEYRSSVQDKITDTLHKITELKHKLRAQQDELQQRLKDQQVMQNQLASQNEQQRELLSANQSQQDNLSHQINVNNKQISELRSQQAAANAALFAGATVQLGSACDTSHGDTYPSPWCSAEQDSMLDSWGMYNRECVSYTAWKVHESGRHMPYWGGRGNANQWDEDAEADGIPVDSRPKAGDVAIKNSYPYGHAMYVESVNGDGTINISQYNADYQGHFSKVYNLSPAGLVFIHFR